MEIQRMIYFITHKLVEIGTTKHYNVSIKNERYDPIYDPLVVEI